MTQNKSGQLALNLWLPIALASTLIMAFTYLSIQQNYRHSANDPQIQIVHDSILDLEKVPDLAQLANAFNQTDISKISNSFLIIFDEKGQPVAGNGYLNGQLPSVPVGTLATAKSKGENRFTWEPQKGLRFAAVLKTFKGQQNGFVLAARSLNETEKREQTLLISAVAAWALVLLASFVWSRFLAQWLLKNFAQIEQPKDLAGLEKENKLD